MAPVGREAPHLYARLQDRGCRINEIVDGKRRITADTALRLARYFGTSDLFWVNLQNRYDLEIERDNLGTTLDEIRPLQSA